MNWLVVGDIQLRRENKEVIRDVLTLVEAQSSNFRRLFVGDMLERRGHIEADCLNMLYEYFRDSEAQHVIIVGNHDKIKLDSTEHSLEPLKSLPNVLIVDKPTVISPEILAMPYYRDPELFLSELELLKEENPDYKYLFCHQGIKEFTVDSGYEESEAIELVNVSSFKRVIVGHYHAPMDKENTCFIGSPVSHSFGESNQNKRLAIFNDVDNTLKFKPVRDMPRHITFEIDCDICTYDGNELTLDKNNYYRVILRGSPENIAKFPKEKYPNVRFREEPIVIINDNKLSENTSNLDKFTKWAKEIRNLDEETIKLGLECLNG